MLLNRKFAFNFDISSFNLKNNYNVYTVYKLSEDEDVINAVLQNAHKFQESASEDSDIDTSQDIISIPTSSTKRKKKNEDEDLVVLSSKPKASHGATNLKIPKIEED